MDAFNEVYHVQGIHPQILENIDDIHVQIDLYERHNRYLVPFGLLSPRYPNQEELTRALKENAAGRGHRSGDVRGRPRGRASGACRTQVKKHAAAHGIDLSELNDDQLSDDYHYYIFPNITLNTHHSGVMLFRQRPHATDPNKMYYDLQNYVRIPEGSEPPPRPVHTTAQARRDSRSGLGLDQGLVQTCRACRRG